MAKKITKMPCRKRPLTVDERVQKVVLELMERRLRELAERAGPKAARLAIKFRNHPEKFQAAFERLWKREAERAMLPAGRDEIEKAAAEFGYQVV